MLTITASKAPGDLCRSGLLGPAQAQPLGWPPQAGAEQPPSDLLFSGAAKGPRTVPPVQGRDQPMAHRGSAHLADRHERQGGGGGGVCARAMGARDGSATARLTDRPIVYRPKPNGIGARPIDGTVWGKGPLLAEALVGCHAVVAHHSNAAVDALLAGVPCVCPDGVASLLRAPDLTEIEQPPMPDGREQWAYDLAWTQWSVEEIERGRRIAIWSRRGCWDELIFFASDKPREQDLAARSWPALASMAGRSSSGPCAPAQMSRARPLSRWLGSRASGCSI
jgi:hypothetical protein